MLQASRSPESKDRKQLNAITAAADRASKLVRQLLTFGRRQFMQAQPMDLRDTLSTVSEMLPRILGEHITVEVLAGSSLPPIVADAGMMEQLLMNLSVNARDAMPDGGRLTIKAESVQLGPEAVQMNHESRAGRFLRLSVTDTGCGIPAENRPVFSSRFSRPSPWAKAPALAWRPFTALPNSTRVGLKFKLSSARARRFLSLSLPASSRPKRTRRFFCRNS